MLIKLLFLALMVGLGLWAYRQYQGLGKVVVGQMAPDFNLSDAFGQMHTLANWQGRWLVLYFYPKDNTQGCTTQACLLRDDIQALRELGAIPVGVSVDNVESHANFTKKHNLPFTLLADTAGEVADTYGVLIDFFGFKFALRTTFLIDPQGKVAYIYTGVNPNMHSRAIVHDLKRLSAYR